MTVWKPIVASESSAMSAGAYFFSAARYSFVSVPVPAAGRATGEAKYSPSAPPFAPWIAFGEVQGSTPKILAVLPSCLSEDRMFGQAAGASDVDRRRACAR